MYSFDWMTLGLLFLEVCSLWLTPECVALSPGCVVLSPGYIVLSPATRGTESCNRWSFVLPYMTAFLLFLTGRLYLFCPLFLSRFVVAGGGLECFFRGAYCVVYTIGFCGFCACFCFCVSRADEAASSPFCRGEILVYFLC